MRRMSQKQPQQPARSPRGSSPRHAHGYVRTSDRPQATNPSGATPGPRRTPPGTPLLMLVAVGLLCSVGIARVHTRTRVLEMGAQISELTSEQARLLDDRRRLEAERAYLRHPEQVRETATTRLGMIPLPADRIQTIRIPGGDQ
jgi:cell division protein FtsL